MKTVGLIVEYNPLHNGHVHHFLESKRVTGAEASVAVMSGHFLQRGEPAVAGKWARAEMALEMGADLVLELPVAFSAQPAEWFAYGAVSALAATGVVDALSFGSESGDLGWLSALADRIHDEPEDFRSLVRKRLAEGTSYPAAYAAAVAEFAGGDSAEALLQPNNSLGLHYLIALRRLESAIRPFTVPRMKAGYHDREAADAHIASATAVRRLLAAGDDSALAAAAPYVPPYVLDILRRERDAGRAPMNWERFASPLLHTLLALPAEEIGRICEVTEGLEHRLKRALADIDYSRGATVEQLLTAVKTKRYTRTKLQRTLLRILLSHRKEQLSRDVLVRGVPYLRVLGFSYRGRELLKRMKRTATVPVITQAARHDIPLLELDIRATSAYSLAFAGPTAEDLFRDYYQAPLQRSN